ncbi:hypothetical protein niasHS_017081 [Heterodera schachtii]|uniref:Transposase n=1 Tax=Heterodera schachtii TaxID=97005 RepID=A0ABD2HYZ2_HETSC
MGIRDGRNFELRASSFENFAFFELRTSSFGFGSKSATFPKTCLREHLQRHHPDKYDQLTKEEEKANDVEKTNGQQSIQTLLLASTSTDRLCLSPTTAKMPRNESQFSSSQPTIVKSFSQWSSDGEMTKKVDHAVMRLICSASLPLSFVEDQALKNLLSILAPISRRHFTSDVLRKLYVKVKARVKADIFKADFISLTIDGWSSLEGKHSLLSVTVHYIDSKMEPTFRVIEAVPIKGSHTGEKICGLLSQVLNDYGVNAEKVHLIVRDNESSMQKATRIAGFESLHCTAHNFNLCVWDGLKKLSIDALLEKIKKSIRKIRKSRVLGDEFSALQDESGIPQRNNGPVEQRFSNARAILRK